MNACTVDITKHLTENNISLESVSYIIAIAIATHMIV